MSQENLLSDNDSENNNPSYQYEHVGGLIEREYEKLMARESARQLLNARKTVVDYKVENFLRGAVNPDRLKHENDVLHGGIAHWRRNTSRQKDHDDYVLHSAVDNRADYNTQVQRNTLSQDKVGHTPGMGYDGQNLLTFITGSHPAIAGDIANAMTAANSATAAPTSPLKEITNSQSAQQQSGTVYAYRRRPSYTYSRLLGQASSQ